MKLNEKPKITIVLDIDDCIATGFTEEPSELEKKYPWVSIFKKKGLYIDAIKPHIIHPGVIEFIQLIHKMPNMKISFYSSGTKERNDLLVKKLLCLALGETKYNAIQSQVIVCSKLEKSIKKLDNEQFENYGIGWGQYKKNLKNISTVDDDLAWTILIDDNITSSYYGQERNILKIPAWGLSFSDEYYDDSEEKNELNWDVFSRPNHIFYATGVIFTALEIAEQEKKCLSDALFQIQFQNKDISAQSKMAFTFNDKLVEDFHYYKRGLEKIKEINSSLEFLTADNYLTEYELNVLTKETVENMISLSGLYQTTPPVTENKAINNANVEQSTISPPRHHLSCNIV